MAKNKFEDYEGFVAKFKPKKTTDDCYTPPAVYDAILEWVKSKQDLSGRPVVRPFCPGGDFEHYDYPDNCVVIDNPPFSILAKIRRFFCEKGIDYFLFAPHLTFFSATIPDTKIVAYSNITYENGANVRTSFVSNLSAFSETEIYIASTLYAAIDQAQKTEKENTKKSLPNFRYNDNTISAALLNPLFEAGADDISIPRNEALPISRLDSQSEAKKQIFGGGYLVSDRIVERLKAERLKAATYFPLSDRERKIINEQLNK